MSRELTVIIPTRNESGNIAPLLQRLSPVTSCQTTEIIFVDDSTDATPQVIERVAAAYPCPVRVIHRTPEERTGGLGGAVVAGMREASGRWIVVMDGDLQHPPELIPDLIAAGRQQGKDLVVASRYSENGDASSFGAIRALVSRSSTLAAKAVFPGKLRHVDDPMTGFFLVRRSSLDLDRLRPNGFKVLLDIVARTPGLRTTSVPFQFGERHSGTSKASFREGLRFLNLLFTLRVGSSIARFSGFGVVGVSGLVINSLLLAFFTEILGIYYMLSMVMATQGSTLWNFSLSEYVVFNRQGSHNGQARRAALFFAMNNVALLARGPIVFNLTSHFGMNYLISNLASMAALLVLRFALADWIIWRSQPELRPAASPSIATTDREVRP
jgi:dolichol-phosphate mannosyltransferase